VATNRAAPPGTMVSLLCYRDTKPAIEWAEVP